MSINTLDWHGCYDDSWKGLISDAAFAHPAKMARGLVRRIFAHMEAQGWLQPRSRVLDVFGGIGTTAIEGASRGHEVVCIELEERFVKLALENFALHRLTWEKMGDQLPVMLHGDSRKAVALARGHFAACVGSPPFYNSLNNSKERSGLVYGNARYGHKDRVGFVSKTGPVSKMASLFLKCRAASEPEPAAEV